MDHHVKEFYNRSSDDYSKGNFHDVIPLHESPDIDWNSISKKIPQLSRGWFELARLNTKDRIEFTRDYWLSKLPYHPNFSEFLFSFFDNLDDIGIFISQKKFADPYEANLIYSLRDNSGFFRGAIGAKEEEILRLQKSFPDYILPVDYLAFLRIHDGFCKATDCTGITKSELMKEKYLQFQETLALEESITITTTKGDQVDPKTLIPFYESFGMPFYQCFWAEWYPENEMGNVYYSGITKTISAVSGEKISSEENMAFPTFSDWLMFYLERIS